MARPLAAARVVAPAAARTTGAGGALAACPRKPRHLLLLSTICGGWRRLLRTAGRRGSDGWVCAACRRGRRHSGSHCLRADLRLLGICPERLWQGSQAVHVLICGVGRAGGQTGRRREGFSLALESSRPAAATTTASNNI